MKRALIIGITGQDGSYLAEELVKDGVSVHGLIRRNSITEHQRTRLDGLGDSISNRYGDILDKSSLTAILREVRPDEIYNLAAQSHVRISFEVPEFTANVNALGVLNLLECMRACCPEAKIYQASSSEMFGNSVDPDGFQRETTTMSPVSPYGCAKLFGYSIIRNYRKAYKLFAANGILFNHESPRRGSNFVTTKVIKNAILIKKGKLNTLELGNLDSKRDWGHSADYVRAMRLILSHETADDFVISTGKAYSVRELCSYVFSRLDLNYEDYVVQSPKFYRPEELTFLCGDSSKARRALGWKPLYDFNGLLDEMLEFWLRKYDETDGFRYYTAA